MPSATNNWASNALTPRMGRPPEYSLFFPSSSKAGPSVRRPFRLTRTRGRLKKCSQNSTLPRKRPMTTEPAHEKLKAAGWSEVETSGFLNLIGPLWERVVDGNYEYAIPTHTN